MDSSNVETTHVTTHVIFDVDGLIIDTESVYADCLTELCARHGKEFTWALQARQMGMKEAESGRLLIDDLDLPITVDEYLATLKPLLEEKLPNARLMPGAERLIRHLHKHKVPIALASGSDNWGFERKTVNHKELFSLFSNVVLSSDDPDVKHGKPAPDCFLIAAKRFNDGVKPEQCLVFEDAPNGVTAALAADMKVAWVPDPRTDTAGLRERVDATLGSLEEFLPQQFGLPAYSD